MMIDIGDIRFWTFAFGALTIGAGMILAGYCVAIGLGDE